MTVALDEPAALLAELTALGIELQARGDRLRFRPLSAMTAELIARVRMHKIGLLALLADTKTPSPPSPFPRSDVTSGGFGRFWCYGVGVGDTRAVTSCAVSGARMIADVPAPLRSAVETVQRIFPRAELVDVRCIAIDSRPTDTAAWPAEEDARSLPDRVSELARLREGRSPETWRGRLAYLADACAALHPDRSAELRRAAIVLTPGLVEAFEERAAIMEYDAGLSREDAEAAAAADTLTLLKGTK